ncbi:MAG: hypothetical protein AM326_07575 [Candidatus Thorarchaeota archaeon SMTZ-45]|nr:MAG: hypothetical protein AM326_07575 [Candidatus Thorarchaeota archaeon SMTZ-45]
MIEEIIAAAMIGSSFGNTWTCALISLGCAIDSKRNGIAFIGGRFLGLIVLGSVVAVIGVIESIGAFYFQLIFGILTLILGIIVLIQVLSPHSIKIKKLLRFPSIFGYKHTNQCQKTLMTNGGDVIKLNSNSKTLYILSLGILRGATPCVKIMVLSPLLISVDFPLAITMVLVFAVASTMYPIIGFLSGNLMRQSKKYIFHVRLSASILMIILSVYFIVTALGGLGH